jgi:type IV fimbrial biogenesis protein FimT
MNKKGFTIAEVLVTISILAIMATISIPTFISWLPTHRLQTSARQIYDDLNLAKMEAVKRNTDVCIRFNMGNNTYRVFVDADSDGAYTSPPDTSLKDKVTLENDVNITNISFGNTIGFNNRGMVATAAVGDIRLTNPSGIIMRITVINSGNISILFSKDGGATWRS